MSPSQSTHQNLPVIMIVDDDGFTRELIKLLLEKEHFTVIEAKDGEEAIAKYLSHSPDLVLMDVLMPKLNGYQACKKLRALSGDDPLPIIMMTSLEDDNAMNDAFDAKASDFISKPLNLTLLIHRIMHALDSRNASLELQAKKNQLAASQEISGSGYFEYNPLTGKVLCSEALYSLLGFKSNEQLLSLHEFLVLMQLKDRALVKQHILSATITGEAYSLEHAMVGINNQEYIVHHQAITSPIAKTGKFHLLGTIIDITATKKKDILIEQQQQLDSLTGLPNRQQIDHLLLSWVMAADYEKKQLGLFFLGLDKFKNVNSTIGHELADNTLKLVADRLKTLESDHLVVTRFSGDKFVVLAKQLDGIDDANMVANQLKSLFTEPFLIDQHEFFITTSIGITLYPQMHSDKKQLVKDAESAMFQAKSLGRNRHEYYREEIGKNFSRKLNLETYLHKALDNNEFEVYYQPQISVLNRRIVGMEALIRWNHPKLGLVSPNDFIPIAEETGMIVPIGSWVMETAARQTALWCKKGYGLLRVGVNLSAKQFQDKDLAKEVIDVIEKTGIMPPSLDLEITESSVMSDISRTISVLHQINEIGVQISMDDFGTGYSSLSYLQQMPLHTLKIDRAFIKDIQPDGTNGEISKVIIAMCHTLGLNVIAEGVETEEQMQFLKMHECNEAQGYFISRPVPAIEMEKLLCANTNPTKKNKMEDLIF